MSSGSRGCAEQYAGAGADRRARKRLLASTSHPLTYEILGAMLPPEMERESAAELAARLGDIDRRIAGDHPCVDACSIRRRPVTDGRPIR